MEKKIRYSLEITEGKKVDKEQKTRVLRKHRKLIRKKTRGVGSLKSSRKKNLFHKGQSVQQYQKPLSGSITDQ